MWGLNCSYCLLNIKLASSMKSVNVFVLLQTEETNIVQYRTALAPTHAHEDLVEFSCRSPRGGIFQTIKVGFVRQNNCWNYVQVCSKGIVVQKYIYRPHTSLCHLLLMNIEIFQEDRREGGLGGLADFNIITLIKGEFIYEMKVLMILLLNFTLSKFYMFVFMN